MLAMRDGNWKLLLNPDRSRVDYDLARDPGGVIDSVASDHADVVARLS